MRVCTKKKYVSHEKSWISMLNSAGIQQKTASVPAYNNLYAYAANNPVRYIDPDGRNPGDKFDSIDEAAKDFEKNYNDDSIRKNAEYGTTIYQDKDGNVIRYGDIPNADRRKKPSYLGTPNDPDRLNKNDANSGEINEFVKHYYPEIK